MLTWKSNLFEMKFSVVQLCSFLLLAVTGPGKWHGFDSARAARSMLIVWSMCIGASVGYLKFLRVSAAWKAVWCRIHALRDVAESSTKGVCVYSYTRMLARADCGQRMSKHLRSAVPAVRYTWCVDPRIVVAIMCANEQRMTGTAVCLHHFWTYPMGRACAMTMTTEWWFSVTMPTHTLVLIRLIILFVCTGLL